MTDGMSPVDIRSLLEGYCLDVKQSTILTATLVVGDADVSVSDASGILPLALVSGTGVPADAYVVDIVGNVITLSANATASGEYSLTFSQYRDLSDDWITKTRDLQVVPIIERALGISLSTSARVTEYASGKGTGVLQLSKKPIIELHSVAMVTNEELFGYVEEDSIELIVEEGILKRRWMPEAWYADNIGFYVGNRNYKVDYTYGYATVPAELKRAVCMMTASFVLGMLGARTGGGSLSIQGHSRTYGARGKYHDARQELDAWAHTIIRQYATGQAGG